MSLKKQIKRNIQRENDKLLGQYGNQLVPDWRLKSAHDKNLLAQMVRNGITAEDLQAERKRGRDEAFQQTAPAVMKVCYSAFAVTLVDDFGFTSQQVFDAIMAVDEKISMTIDHEELIREMEEKASVRFYADEGIERVVQL